MSTNVLNSVALSSPSVAIEHVQFQGGTLDALRQDGHGWLVLKPVCETLGIDARGQQQRLERQVWATGCMTQAVVVAADGKRRKLACLRIDRVAMWLATLDAQRIKNPAARARVEIFQCQASDALDKWWRGPAQPKRKATRDILEEPIIHDHPDTLRFEKGSHKVLDGLHFYPDGTTARQVVAAGDSSVHVTGDLVTVACDRARVYSCGNHVWSYNDSQVVARGGTVHAHNSSRVVAKIGVVFAYDTSRIEASDEAVVIIPNDSPSMPNDPIVKLHGTASLIDQRQRVKRLAAGTSPAVLPPS